jgi:hypothetical protein
MKCKPDHLRTAHRPRRMDRDDEPAAQNSF